MKTLLVDGDILVYRCGFAAEKKWYAITLEDGTRLEFNGKRELGDWAKDNPGHEFSMETIHEIQPKAFALNNVRTVMDTLIGKFEGELEVYLTGKGNYRNDIATIREYKGNRKDAPKPIYYQDIRDYMCKKYGAVVVDGQEADDEIGIRATELGDDAIIITTDKDLDTIPGWHYNWVKGDHYYVDERTANRNFYLQILTGDSTDNILGIQGVGPVGAAKLLGDNTTPKGMWQACLAAYVDKYPKGCEGVSAKNAAIQTARLVYIRKHRDEIWSPP